jgi:hypothetical protein
MAGDVRLQAGVALPVSTIYVLGASHVTVSASGSLSGFTQGDGSHLLGRTITLNAPAWQGIPVNDDDANFADNDGNQTLSGSAVLNGTTYASGRVVEAEYTITVRDPLGHTYQVIGFNINEPGSPYASYGTVEGLAFIGPPGSWPPVGTPLTVIGTAEGPANTGAGAQPYGNYVAPICYVTGTRIDTPSGPRPVERLRPGDLVLTRDNGPQPLVWTGAMTVGTTPLAAVEAFRPVRIEAGALGPGLPAHSLTVSRQHRLLVSGWQVDLQFGHAEVLVAAGALRGQPGVCDAAPEGAWSYHHLLCREHELLRAEGAWAESFLPGPEALSALTPKARAGLEKVMAERGCCPAMALPALRGWEGRIAAAALAGAA